MEKLTAIKNHFFFSQPHQPFFVLAFTNAFVSMLLFMMIFKGIFSIEIGSNHYHSYSLINLLFTTAFFGFLFTTFPRFSATELIPKKQYLIVFGLFFMGSVLFYIGIFISKNLVLLAMFIVFLGHVRALQILWGIYQDSTVTDKEDQKWILITMGFGVVAHFLFLLSSWLPWLYYFSIQIAIYLYLFLLTFVIAQRMVPFFSHSSIHKHRERFEVIVGLLVLHILLELIEPHSSFLVDFFIAYFVGRELYRWRLPFPNANPLIWILHIALFWIPIAFFIAGVSNIIVLVSGLNFLGMDIHVLLIGFLLTILIGFGTRVTLGHSGNVMKADKWVLFLFYWTQVVVLMRFLTSIALANGWNFVLFFDVSVTVWLVLFGVWASRFFGVLIFGKKLEK